FTTRNQSKIRSSRAVICTSRPSQPQRAHPVAAAPRVVVQLSIPHVKNTINSKRQKHEEPRESDRFLVRLLVASGPPRTTHLTIFPLYFLLFLSSPLCPAYPTIYLPTSITHKVR